jgi:hypothetical protein
MSSTDNDSHTAAIRDLFLNKLLPAAQKEGRPRAFFPVGPDPAADTYYIDRPARKMTRDDFLIRTPDGSGDPIVALGELWKSQGLDRLAALVPELRAIAGELRQIEKPADDVSPFIYVMF